MAKWKGEEVTDAQYTKLWRADNPERVRATARRYYEKKKAAVAARGVKVKRLLLEPEESEKLRKAYEAWVGRRRRI